MSKSFELCIDSFECKEKPSDEKLQEYEDYFGNPRSLISVIMGRIATQPTKVTQSQLEEAINKGQTICPSIFAKCPDWKRQRKTKNLWLKSKALFWDFDEHIESIDEMRQKLIDIGLDFTFIYRTFSWTPEHKKHRGVILLEDYITDAEEYETILMYIGRIFDGQSDKSCFECSRAYYSGYKNCVVYSSGYRASSDLFDSIIGDEGKARIKQELRSGVSKLSNGLTTYSYGEFSAKNLAEAKIEQKRRLAEEKDTLEKLRIKDELQRTINYLGYFDGRNGNPRYTTLWNAARATAQTGFWVPDLLHHWLINAIKDNSYFNEEWDKNADEVIKTGMEFGYRIASEAA